jgi:hypothetical protein
MGGAAAPWGEEDEGDEKKEKTREEIGNDAARP